MSNKKETGQTSANAATGPDDASRRSFLVGGAAAAGAIAAAALPAEAQAHCVRGCGPIPIEQMDLYGTLLVSFWEDATKWAGLLTFGEQGIADWAAYKADERQEKIDQTRRAFKKAGIILPADIDPVVLTHAQFELDSFRPWSSRERVFQVPDKPDNKQRYPDFYASLKPEQKLSLAKFSLDLHICGM